MYDKQKPYKNNISKEVSRPALSAVFAKTVGYELARDIVNRMPPALLDKLYMEYVIAPYNRGQ
jgi:hypothetical protein